MINTVKPRLIWHVKSENNPGLIDMACSSWPTQPRAFSNQIECADYEFLVFFAKKTA